MQTWVLCWLKEGDKLEGIQRREIKNYERAEDIYV